MRHASPVVANEDARGVAKGRDDFSTIFAVRWFKEYSEDPTGWSMSPYPLWRERNYTINGVPYNILDSRVEFYQFVLLRTNLFQLANLHYLISTATW